MKSRTGGLDKENYCDISIVVCSYNSTIEAMLFTLDSIIKQRQISFEIVIADDGSKDNLSGEIKKYFEKIKFNNWTMICNVKNQGTVCNLYTGLEKSRGKYVKVISPGDALYSSSVLREWIDYNESNNYTWSFSDAIYYTGNICDKKYVKCQAHPNNVKPYLRKKAKVCRWNYIVWDDIALGATLICERYLMITYVKKILNKVKYAEDNIWRMMMFDGIIGGYFPRPTVFYEYGTGVSTNGNDIWRKRLEQDWEATNYIMLEDKILNRFQKSIIKAWKKKNSNNRLLKVLVKGWISNYYSKKINIRYTYANNIEI